MCFSAPASFTVAAATSAIGAVALMRVSDARQLPLASFPVIFGAQQAVEGLLWLTLRNTLPPIFTAALANTFIFVALAVWPLLAPIAVALVEPVSIRRYVIAGLAVPGLAVAIYALSSIAQHPYAAAIAGHSICYVGAYQFPLWGMAAYALSTCAPLFLASDRMLRLLGAVIGFGAVVSALFFYESFVSVWCFFAAAASVAVWIKIEQDHRLRNVASATGGRQ